MIAMALAVAASIVGLAVGFVAMLQAGISREESDRSLLSEPATRAAKATRCLVGLYVRTPDRIAEADPRRASGSLRRPPIRPAR